MVCAIRCSPQWGYNWGAGKFSRVRAIEKCCFAAAAVVSLLAAVVIALFPAPITLLFMPSAQGAVLAMSVGALQLFSITYITRWFSFATQSYMLAIEKPFSRFADLGLDRTGVSRAAGGRALADGPDRHLAQLCRHGAACGGAGRRGADPAAACAASARSVRFFRISKQKQAPHPRKGTAPVSE